MTVYLENLLKYDLTRLKGDELANHIANKELEYLRIILVNNGTETEGTPKSHPIFHLTK